MICRLIFLNILQARTSLFIIFIDIRTIKWPYFSYIIHSKKTRKIALDQVATFSLQPAADVDRAHLQQRG